MNWEAIAAISQTVAALGVIATLIYLGLQVRHSVRGQRSSSQHALLSEIRTLINVLVQDKELARAWYQYCDEGDVTEDLRPQFEMWISNIFRFYEEVFNYYQEGAIAKPMWDARYSFMRSFFLSRPLTVRWWKSEAARFFSQPFQDLVNKGLPETEEVEHD